ncbi:MAG: LytTR family DNA-binding domain-containing protein [Bacteroidales bacterium]|nr:LytTR family DNA-binding domain-containing protein [Bacteroidales bacterium]
MIKCIIIDDEFPARILLKEFIEKIPTLELIGSYKSGIDALPTLQAGEVDLMFLDIQMPDITGVNFVKMLGNRKPLVVFTTAYSEYAIESYQLDVLDYLLKPFSFDRFMQAVGKAIARTSSVSASEPTANSNKAEDETENTNDFMLIKQEHKISRVKFDSILYIEGLREYITIHCKDEKILVRDTLKNITDALPPDKFKRVQKSFIVRTDIIKTLYGNQIEIEGVKDPIPVGKLYLDSIKKLFKEK